MQFGLIWDRLLMNLSVDRFRTYFGAIIARAMWFVLSVLAFGILVGHQTLGVIDRDEARFAQASKQMLESGDYITPRFMDELRAKKPIGIY